LLAPYWTLVQYLFSFNSHKFFLNPIHLRPFLWINFGRPGTGESICHVEGEECTTALLKV